MNKLLLIFIVLLAISCNGQDYSVEDKMTQTINAENVDYLIIECYCSNVVVIKENQDNIIKIEINGKIESKGYHGQQKTPKGIGQETLSLKTELSNDTLRLISKEWTYLHHSFLIDELKIQIPKDLKYEINKIQLEQLEGREVSIDQELKPNQSNHIDTTKFIKFVANDILNRIQGKNIRKSEFEENGNFYIEYHEDTTDADSKDAVWEYYLIEKDEIILGKLNSDEKIDFAIRSTWGPVNGNLYGLEWHIYVSEKDKYKRIENDFGGGKFSDMEAITEINKMILKTEFKEMDEETARLNDSVEFREYELKEGKLKK